MDMQYFMRFMADNMPFMVTGLVVVALVLLVMVINLTMRLNYMQKRYKKMMTGVDGANLERVLMGHIDEVKRVAAECVRLDAEEKRLDDILQTAITRVGVVRFRAFEDMGSDLSYAVALLDAHNNGVVLSSIFGREDSRSYVKPIKAGESTYTMTDEEQQALKEAMGK